MVACIVNFAVGIKGSGSDLGSSIGYAPHNISNSPLIVLTSIQDTSSSSHLSPSCCGTGKHISPLPLTTPYNPAPRPIYNGYMKVCLFHVWFSPPGGLPHSLQGASIVLLCARSVLLQPLALNAFPDIYFFFCGWHLLFSIYMCDSSPGLFDTRPDLLFLGSSVSQGKFAMWPA